MDEDLDLKIAISHIVEERPEDIDDVIVIVKGKCHKCGKRDGMAIATNVRDFEPFTVLISQAARYQYAVASQQHFMNFFEALSDEEIMDMLKPDDPENGATSA